MATLPRSKAPLTPKGMSPPSVFITRTASDFDSGINTSAAWTEHRRSSKAGRDVSDTLSLEESGGEDGAAAATHGDRPARAVHDFAGKPEFQELNMLAGDTLHVLKEEVGDGWSLVRHRGEVGLVPRAYYIFTADFVSSPPETLEGLPSHFREASETTPRQSVADAAPLIPQNTGEWTYALPSFRRSLLGGKTLNRFSGFVTTGAEDFILNGTAEDVASASHSHGKESSFGSTSSGSDPGDTGDASNVESKRTSANGADKHFVESGHSWKEKLPPFRVLVHSPTKNTSTISGAFTVYSVTSIFNSPDAAHSQHILGNIVHKSDSDGDDNSSGSTTITVHRRFSQFVFLHTALTRRLPGIALPPLPEKQYAGRFSDDFVEARRGDLQRYINKLVRHPVVRYAEVTTFFLSCESDVEWKRLVPRHLALPPAGPSFYARVYHPAFNIDAEDAGETGERFARHTRAVGRGVQDLRNVFGAVRQSRVEMSNAERMLSYTLLSLITSTPVASGSMSTVQEDADDDDENETRHKDTTRRGLMNEEGAWCWREDCADCLSLTKAMQKTSESLRGVADLYHDHARRTTLATHEAMKDVAHPSTLYSPVLETHKSTLTKYREAVNPNMTDDEVASRCETVLNTTMAEFETYHVQKQEDFKRITTEYLDDEIAFYEKVLSRLRTARQAFDPPTGSRVVPPGARQPSVYERELANPVTTVPPIPQPCPHVFDSAPMRPVSAAIQGGMSVIMGNPGAGRASVFGKFW